MIKSKGVIVSLGLVVSMLILGCRLESLLSPTPTPLEHCLYWKRLE